MTIEKYDQLEEGLRNWTNFGGGPPYDQVGIFELFCCCISNMQSHLHDDLLLELGETLTSDERKFLTTLLSSPPEADSNK